MKSNSVYPIYDNRLVVGYAKTKSQAEKVVFNLLQTIPKGWRVTAQMRNVEIIDLPVGWVYSVHP
jgi:hypothetical protein